LKCYQMNISSSIKFAKTAIPWIFKKVTK
jgi:hypothetical protein